MDRLKMSVLYGADAVYLAGTSFGMRAFAGNFTPEEMEEYENSLKNMSDYYNIIDSAAELAEKRGREAGMAEGLAKGREEGREEGRNQTIRQLLESGMSIDMIAEALNLTNEERLQFR